VDAALLGRARAVERLRSKTGVIASEAEAVMQCVLQTPFYYGFTVFFMLVVQIQAASQGEEKSRTAGSAEQHGGGEGLDSGR
jgi:hypothetical protein